MLLAVVRLFKVDPLGALPRLGLWLLSGSVVVMAALTFPDWPELLGLNEPILSTFVLSVLATLITLIAGRFGSQAAS